MPLQNRVDPFGAIHAVSARGTLMGNRGVIHDAGTRALLKRRWTTKSWIICLCAFKGRHRRVMAPGSYTELFFLDEVTALAAGHRPCFECQRERARHFAACFSEAAGRAQMRAPEIDARLHGERLAVGNLAPAIEAGAIADLPDGVMLVRAGIAYAVKGKALLPWSFEGYGTPVSLASLPNDGWRLLTPASTLAAIRNGFAPSFHETAAVTPRS